jgi:hypothetical protein
LRRGERGKGTYHRFRRNVAGVLNECNEFEHSS